jgi:probable phosphoglycerate mutase
LTLNVEKIKILAPRMTDSPLIVLVRHGEAGHMVSDLTGGWTNSNLTETGRVQADAVAQWLSEELPSGHIRILSSDLNRAVQTTEPIAEALGVDFTRHQGIRELNNGIAAGKTKQEAKPFLDESSKISIDWHPYPKSESWREFYARVTDFMNGVNPPLDETVVIVCHGGTINMITSWWLGLEPEHMNRVFFQCAPTGVTILHQDRYDNHVIERLNDTYHLTRNGSRNPFPRKQA